MVALALQSVHDQVYFVRHLSVYALSLLVVRVDVACPSQRFVDIPLHEQVHVSLPHSMRPLALMRGPILKMISLIDSSRPLSPHTSTMALRPTLGFWLSCFQSVESQDAVLVHHGHEVCCDAHGTEVEQRDEAREGNAVVLGKGLA